MDFIPNCSVDLVITSPPYNMGIKYDEYNDNLSWEEYEQLLYDVFKECYRVLTIGGRMAINVAGVGRKPYIFIPALIERVVNKINESLNAFGSNYPLLCRGIVLWDKSVSVGQSTSWGSWLSPSNPTLRDVHEFILIYSKGEYKLQHSGDTDLTKDEFLEWTKSIWSFPTVSAKKLKHPAPYPEELPRRLIKLYSYQNDVILDPFMGCGTTLIAAQKLNRRWIGVDMSRGYCDLAEKNLSEVKDIEMGSKGT